MSKINSPLEHQAKNQDSQLKSLNKQLQKKISSKEKEIEYMNDFYKQKKSLVNESSKMDLAKLNDENQQRLLVESQNYEDKIQSYRDKLETIQGAISKEENMLKETKSNKLNNLKADLDATFAGQAEEAMINQNALIAQTKEVVSANNQKAKQEKTSIQNHTSKEIQAYSLEQNNKISTNEQYYKKLNEDLIKKNESESKELQTQLRIQRQASNTKNQRIDNEVTRINDESLNFKQKYHQNQLMQLDKDFKTKYENITKVHNQMLQEISLKLEDDITKVVTQNANQKGLVESKSQDEFYRVSVLRPKVQELEKAVLVSLPVAEYEKSNVFLSAGERNIKITLSRNYTNQIKDADESFNKSTRSELFSKEFNTTDILNPRDITQKYENGILSFRILKA